MLCHGLNINFQIFRTRVVLCTSDVYVYIQQVRGKREGRRVTRKTWIWNKATEYIPISYALFYTIYTIYIIVTFSNPPFPPYLFSLQGFFLLIYLFLKTTKRLISICVD